ncbi:ParB/RepB/Spo0J family partition protein [Deinococcus planocerae]|uniref:ParB/RepB/Spo0J family partition protein n=1 Tax=Deinococcus planocerae TaxID=1737569 RepID=UPI000C7F0F6A|nr:ParB/RepB/Spo0J family partition protein [Deinococcus planocerae]
MARRRFDASATLSALLGPDGAADLTSRDQLRALPLDALSPTPYQPRGEFDGASLEDLAGSIRENGVLQPVLVRPREGGGYEIVAGERRWRAARLAGLSEIPAYIRDLTDDQAAAASAVENLLREDLNPVEEVEAKRRIAALALGLPDEEVMTRLRHLLDHPEEDPEGVSQLDAAFARLGGEKWQSFLRNKGRVLNLPPDVKAAVRQGLDYRKALAVGGVADARERARLLTLAREGATVAALTEAARPRRGEGPAEGRRQAIVRTLGRKRFLTALPGERRVRVEELLEELDRLLHEKEPSEKPTRRGRRSG